MFGQQFKLALFLRRRIHVVLRRNLQKIYFPATQKEVAAKLLAETQPDTQRWQLLDHHSIRETRSHGDAAKAIESLQRYSIQPPFHRVAPNQLPHPPHPPPPHPPPPQLLDEQLLPELALQPPPLLTPA